MGIVTFIPTVSSIFGELGLTLVSVSVLWGLSSEECIFLPLRGRLIIFAGGSVHGIFQARVLEWVAISMFRGCSWSRDRTQVSRIAGRCFTEEFAYQCKGCGVISGSGGFLAEGNSNPCQYSCLGNPRYCSRPGSSVHGITEDKT